MDNPLTVVQDVADLVTRTNRQLDYATWYAVGSLALLLYIAVQVQKRS